MKYIYSRSPLSFKQLRSDFTSCEVQAPLLTALETLEITLKNKIMHKSQDAQKPCFLLQNKMQNKRELFFLQTKVLTERDTLEV